MGVVQLYNLATETANAKPAQLFYDSLRMRVSLLKLADGEQIPPHNGDCNVMLLAVSGRGLFTIGEETVEAEEGSLLMIPAHVVRGITSVKDFRVLCVTNNCGNCNLDK